MRPTILTILLALAVQAQPPSIASRYDFKTIDFPGSIVSYPLGINDQREIAGFYADTSFVIHGYRWKNGKFTTIDYPGAQQVPFAGTYAGGINNRGDIAGIYNDRQGFSHGFLLARPAGCDRNDDDGEGDDNERGGGCKPAFTTIDVPGATQTTGIVFELGTGLGTAAVGLNNAGSVVGLYATSGLFSNGFLRSHGAFTPIDHPQAAHLPGLGTKCFAINDRGAMACDYITQANAQAPPITHGFLQDGAGRAGIEVPGSAQGFFGTQISGVNNARTVVGVYGAATNLAGMVWMDGRYFTLNYPNKPFTELHSINNRGEITGAYSPLPDASEIHGFIAILKDR